MKYAIDSNVIIDMTRKSFLSFSTIRAKIAAGAKIAIPSIVDYEVQRGFYHTPSSKKEFAYNRLKSDCIMLEMNAAILDQAAKIWANLKKRGAQIKECDILIAATCLHYEYILVTTDQHFDRIAGLQTENWLEQ
ncbi:MAG: PIN domain-containing protein [Defluviitaleaceae bacterium]|nr:PIN domain-containing protein [Defluviitaleaceae bacterium]